MSLQQRDCIEFLKDQPDGSIKLFVTSPPYNLLNSTGNGMKGSSWRWKNAALVQGYTDHEDCMPHEEYVAWQREFLTEAMRCLQEDGAIFYNHKWRVQDKLLQGRQDIVEGFPIRQIIIWDRGSGMNFNDAYFVPCYEVIYLIAKPKFELLKGKNGLGDVWRFPPERNNDHPAPFPLELAMRCISSVPSGLVCDPFIGSGTTAVAAKMLGRDFIGCDTSAEYIKIAQQRVDSIVL